MVFGRQAWNAINGRDMGVPSDDDASEEANPGGGLAQVSEEEGEAPDEEDKQLDLEELADQREEELDAQVSACQECSSVSAGSDVMLLQAALLEEEESDEEESDDEEADPAAVTMAEGELIPVVSLLKNVTKM